MKRSTIFGAAALIAIWAVSVNAQEPYATTTTTTVTNATGTISQLNYGSNGAVEGFLVGTNILLNLPTTICGGIGTLGTVGNSITYSGTAVTATSGFQSVRVTSFTNNTTKATYTAPTGATSPTAYGPTSGTVKQLNYGTDGVADGFLFTATGSTSPIFVSIGGRTSTALTTALVVGAAVSAIGVTSPSLSACSSTATLETVDASSLTIGTQTFVFGGSGGFGGFGGRH
jgi:hypothetical protein